MCLHINTNHHPVTLAGTGTRTSHIATTPILVYKVLHRMTKDNGRSPYQQFLWCFGKTYTARLRKTPGYVNKGLHAYRTLSRAKNIVHCDYSGTRTICYGIIPVGARFWVGVMDDIASDQMVVYPTLAMLEKHHGKVSQRARKLETFI